jgi:hypothetical protein
MFERKRKFINNEPPDCHSLIGFNAITLFFFFTASFDNFWLG